MTGLLIAFVIVALVPLFVATWRTSLLGLALQGALIAWLGLRHETRPSLDAVLTAIDLVALRMVLAPALLFRAMRRRNAAPRNDVIAPNLISWAIVVTLVVVAFRVADTLVPAEGDEQMLVAVSSAGFLLGLYVLSTARGTFSQIIGILRIENAIALFELGAPDHGASVIRLGMTVVLMASILFYRWYLEEVPSDDHAAVAETPAL